VIIEAMKRPLWQIVLTLIAIGFAADRSVAAVMAHYGGAPTAAVVVQGIFAAVALGAAVAFWFWKGAKPEVSEGSGEA
jgi:hypothetical protein